MSDADEPKVDLQIRRSEVLSIYLKTAAHKKAILTQAHP
jgi:hypothetical protein